MAFPNNNNSWMFNQPASTHCPPVYNYFNHQAGYAVQEPGHANYGHFGQYNNVYQPPPFPSSSIPHVMRDTIQREIEKEQVREHIIVSEITNRRALEAEIQRDLMLLDKELAQRREKKALLLGLPPVSIPMQGELARHRESNTFLHGLPPASGRKEGELNQQRKGNALLLGLPPVSGPKEGTVREGRSVHEKVALSSEKKEALNTASREMLPFQRGAGDLKYPGKTETLNAVSCETLLFHKGAGDMKSPVKKESMNAASHETLPFQKEGGDLKSVQEKETLEAISRGTLPFQSGAADLKISEVKPINYATELRKEVKIDLPAKPNANISGLKRKAVTPPLPDSIKSPSGSQFNKKAKKGWSCGLCQVTVTSETTLHSHLSGKRHKMMEESLQTQISRMVGSLSKTPVSNNIVEIATDSLLSNKPLDLSAKNNDLLANPKPGNLNAKVETVANVRTNVEPKRPYYTFWCKTCEVGAMKKDIMEAHKNGKKHAKQLKGVKTGKPGK